MHKFPSKLPGIGVVLCVGLLAACALSQPASDASSRSATARVMFEERCRHAGERISRVVEDVESIFLLKVRPTRVNYADQFAMDDPYGRDLGGQGYIASFVKGSFQANSKDVPAGYPARIGYRYVEAVDATDGIRYRYTGEVRAHERVSSLLIGGSGKTFVTTGFVLDRAPATGEPPRYGVTYDDISTASEREYWIAGSSLKVIDLQTREVIAERVGYMYDRAQGSTAGQRSPWLVAANDACPAFGREYKGRKLFEGHDSTLQPRQAQDFVEKVLRPKR